MDDFFGEDVAATYDADSSAMFGETVLGPAVDALTALARGGRALEFAIGTGRVALPLAARGVDVSGIDLSPSMVARLRSKPGGDAVPVTIGDFSTTRVPGEFSLVYLVFNTIGNVTTQDDQVAVFANAAAHLAPGGRFVVETGVPTSNEHHRLFLTGPPTWGYDVVDPVTQRMSSNYVTVTDDGRGRFRSIPFRYVWPSELDLMARMAGMWLTDRWADWSGAPFTAESRSHVSVWQRR